MFDPKFPGWRIAQLADDGPAPRVRSRPARVLGAGEVMPLVLNGEAIKMLSVRTFVKSS